MKRHTNIAPRLKHARMWLKRSYQEHMLVPGSAACLMGATLLFGYAFSLTQARMRSDVEQLLKTIAPVCYIQDGIVSCPNLKRPAKKTSFKTNLAQQRINVATIASLLQIPQAQSVQTIGQILRPAAQDSFPAFDHAVFPVSRVPNWGAMRTPAVWNRTYTQMTDADFRPVPAYDLSALTIPLSQLTNPIKDESIPLLTAKLFYSTRFFGAYDLDSGEFQAIHPGIDLKLADGTPIGSIGGGRVHAVRTTANLGLHVIVEHRLQNGETFYSVYGHLESASVGTGDDIEPGQTIGRIGMTGNTSGPHLHLQIDRGTGRADHFPYAPLVMPTRGEADHWVVNPITFITQYSQGD